MLQRAIERVYDDVGSPGIFRNDRFWLAGDHRVEPGLYEEPAVKALMKSSLRAKRDFKMTDFQGFNVSRAPVSRAYVSVLLTFAVLHTSYGICQGACSARHALCWS